MAETWRVAIGDAGGTHGRVSASAGRDAWVGWYFHAVLRAAPLPSGPLGGEALTASCLVVETSLIAEQAAYHAQRAERASWQSRGLAGWGEICLLATALLVLIKAALVLFGSKTTEPWVDGLETAAQILLVFSVAFITLRIYAELELLAETTRPWPG